MHQYEGHNSLRNLQRFDVMGNTMESIYKHEGQNFEIFKAQNENLKFENNFTILEFLGDIIVDL